MRVVARVGLRPWSISAGIVAIAFANFVHAAGLSDGLADAERVLREAGGSDSMDAQRQRFGALAVLQTAARRVTTLNGAKPTPDDEARVGAYNRALQQVMREVAQTGAPNCQGEDCPAAQLRIATSDLMRSDAFVRGVFDRFATSAWRDAHLATVLGRSAPATASPPAAVAPAPAAAKADAASGEFAFLAEMPTVDRVLREMVGSDPVDTKVQQYAAFQMIAMDFMLTQRGAAREVPPRFTELDRAYKAEVLRLDRELRADVAPTSLPPAEAAQRWAPVFRQLNGYAGSPAFRQSLMQRFFSAGWIEGYERKKGQFEQWRTVAMSPAAANAVAAPAANVPPTRIAPSSSGPTAPVVSTEALRELRSASGTDMMVLGVPMGEPLRLPLCAATAQGDSPLATMLGGLERALSPTATVCQNVSVETASGRSALGIKLPSDRCPDWLNILCLLSGVLHNGRVVQLEIGTRGLEVAESVAGILREKYGKPSSSKRVQWSNDIGGRWEGDELTWDLKDLVVEFKPMVGRRDIGRIFITTAEGKRFLEAERKREAAAQPRL